MSPVGTCRTWNSSVALLSLTCFLNLLQVLKTIPWEKVDIEVLTIETNHAGEVFEGTRDDIKEFLEDKGYVLVNTVGKTRLEFKVFSLE